MKRNYGKRTIKSAVDGGWEVKSSEVPEALDMFVEYFGEETAVDEIARSMGTDTLNDNLDWVIRQWGFAEDVEDMDDPWDKYEYAKEVMGVHELFENLTGAAGYDELAEDLAFIFRQYDFREWDERNGIESSRKPIKSSCKPIKSDLDFVNKGDKTIVKKNGRIVAFIGERPHGGFYYAFGKPSASHYMSFDVDDYETAVSRIKEFAEDEEGVFSSSRKPIKSSYKEDNMLSLRGFLMKSILSDDEKRAFRKFIENRGFANDKWSFEAWETIYYNWKNGKKGYTEEVEIESSCKPIKSSYDDTFTVYPWDSERVTPTSDEDLGLSYAIEVYGGEFVNVSDDELDAMKDTLARYFDEDAFVRDWNINASEDDEKIDSFYDVYSDPDELDIEQLSRYFDYDAFGRDIRLEYNMVWDNKRECWFSARDVDSFENEDDIVFLGNSRKQVKSGRYDEVDPHAVEDLYLTTINDGEIYHRFIMPTIENLRKHNRRGQYDRNKAMISWMRVADEGAKQYDRDFGSGRGSVTMFSPATRKRVAEKMASYYEDDVMEGAVESSRKIGSSTYKVFPTENEDTYQYYPFNDDIEADEFCKRNGYTHYEKVNDRSFEDDFDNIIREF